MTNHRLLSVFCVLCLCTLALRAQEEDVLRPHGKPLTEEEKSQFSWLNKPEKKPFMIGVEAGMNYNMFSQSMDRSPQLANSVNDVLQSGSGVSPFFGLVIEEALSHELALQLKFMYDMKSYSNTKNGIIDAVNNSTGEIKDEALTATYKATVNYLSVVPTLRYNVSENYFVTVGLNFQSMMGDFNREDELSKADNDSTTVISLDYLANPGSFSKISRTVIKATDFLPPVQQGLGQESSKFMDYTTTRVGLELGAGYLMQLANTTALAFQLRYQYMLTPLNDAFTVTDISRAPSQQLSNVQYKDPLLHSLQLSVALWFKVM